MSSILEKGFEVLVQMVNGTISAVPVPKDARLIDLQKPFKTWIAPSQQIWSFSGKPVDDPARSLASYMIGHLSTVQLQARPRRDNTNLKHAFGETYCDYNPITNPLAEMLRQSVKRSALEDAARSEKLPIIGSQWLRPVHNMNLTDGLIRNYTNPYCNYLNDTWTVPTTGEFNHSAQLVPKAALPMKQSCTWLGDTIFPYSVKLGPQCSLRGHMNMNIREVRRLAHRPGFTNPYCEHLMSYARPLYPGLPIPTSREYKSSTQLVSDVCVTGGSWITREIHRLQRQRELSPWMAEH